MARISDEELNRLKQEVSLERLVAARGVELKRHGADLHGRCPFHEDDTPSLVVTPGNNLWRCFGACQTGGSVIDWVMKAEGVSFRHAVELLRADAVASGPVVPVKRATARKLAPPVSLDADDQALLRQVVDYYHSTLQQSPEALAYLEKRGLRSPELIERFQLGFANRTLGLRLPAKNREAGEVIRARLQKLGLIRESGHEHLNGSLVIPIIDAAGNVQGMYGRKITPNLRPGTPQHLYLPGPHRGVFNEAELGKVKTVILCEALIDALSFWVAGYTNVTASYGVEGFTEEHLACLQSNGIERVIIAYDRDEAGEKAAEALGKRLMGEGLECYRVQFPKGMDANDFMLKVKPMEKSLDLVLKQALWMGKGVPAPQRAATKAALELAAKTKAPVVKPVPSPSTGSGQAPAEGDSVVVEPTVSPLAAAVAPATAPSPTVAPTSSKAKPPLPALAEVAPVAQLAAPAAAEASAASIPSKAVPPLPGVTEAPHVARPVAAPPAPSPTKATEPAALPSTGACPEPVEGLGTGSATDEVVLHFADRRYRVRGLSKNTSFDALKVNLLVSKGDSFHVDTLDLYSAKARSAFLAQALTELRLDADLLKHDLGQVLLKLESLHEEGLRKLAEPKAKAVTLSEEQRAAALELLRDPKLLERILGDFTRCGVVGEETNKLVGYLAAVSRKLEEPLAVIVQSSSAAGKSSLMDAVLAFVPEEERVQYSAMTGQSLFYMGETDLKHKVLAIVEEEGASRASYALKLLQSEGELTIASPGKDPQTGKLVTHAYRVEGPTQLFMTTTASDLDEELRNRCVVLAVDEERGQTQAIHQLQRQRQTLEGLLTRRSRQAILQVHRNAQRMLRPLVVSNGFAPYLTFLDDRTRMRRDHVKYLTLIRTIALLHQYQRPVKTVQHEGQAVEYIEVRLADVEIANKLAHQVLGRSLDDLPPQTRRLLMLLDGFVSESCAKEKRERRDFRFTRRQVREATGWGNTQVKIHLGRLEELEYVLARRSSGGSGFHYELVYDGQGKDGTPFLAGLVEVAQLEQYGATGEHYDTERSGVNGPLSGRLRAVIGPLSGGGRVSESDESSSGAESLGAAEPTRAKSAVLGTSAKSESYVAAPAVASAP